MYEIYMETEVDNKMANGSEFNENGKMTESHQKEQKIRTSIWIGLGIIVLLIGIGVVLMLTDLKNSSSKSSDSNSTFVSMIPVWIAVFVPALVARDKDTKPMTKREKQLLYFAIACVLLALVAGVIIFVFI